MLLPIQHTVNSLCNKWISLGSTMYHKTKDYRNNSFISVFFGFIFTQGSAVGREALHARKMHRQYVCSWYFSATDFTLAYETCLDRFGVPNLCTAISHPHSAKHHEELSLNLSPSEEDFRVLVPTETYSTKSITSLTNATIPIQSHTSLPSVVSPYQLLPEETVTFSKKDNSFPLGCANESASSGELGIMNLQSSSPKHKAWHSLIK